MCMLICLPFKRQVRESTKVLVGTLMASRDLDISIVTSRLVCMSYPSEGIDLNYKNQVRLPFIDCIAIALDVYFDMYLPRSKRCVRFWRVTTPTTTLWSTSQTGDTLTRDFPEERS